MRLPTEVWTVLFRGRAGPLFLLLFSFDLLAAACDGDRARPVSRQAQGPECHLPLLLVLLGSGRAPRAGAGLTHIRCGPTDEPSPHCARERDPCSTQQRMDREGLWLLWEPQARGAK